MMMMETRCMLESCVSLLQISEKSQENDVHGVSCRWPHFLDLRAWSLPKTVRVHRRGKHAAVLVSRCCVAHKDGNNNSVCSTQLFAEVVSTSDERRASCQTSPVVPKVGKKTSRRTLTSHLHLRHIEGREAVQNGKVQRRLDRGKLQPTGEAAAGRPPITCKCGLKCSRVVPRETERLLALSKMYAGKEHSGSQRTQKC